jgi:hypothetical protein
MAAAAKLAAPGRAAVRAPLAPMHDGPSPAAVQTSQRLAGFEMDLLKNEGDWFLARGTDGYEGWMHRAYLSPAPSSGARRSSQIIRISLGCVTRSAAGDRRALPLGARLSPDEIVRSGEVVEQPQLPVKFPRTALAITRSAKEYFEGTPYLWGGITPWGADCSGFVQTVYGLHGVALPRDAKLQAQVGDDIADINKIETGDLAFFSDNGDGVISHVALVLGEGRVAHVAIGRAGFHVENLGDRRDAYAKQLADRFVRARRVL